MIVLKRPDLLDLGFGSDSTFNGVKVIDVILEVLEFKYEPWVELFDKKVKGVKLKKGDKVICRWLEIEDAMTSMDGDLFVPNSAVIAKFNGDIEPVHGYQIVKDVEHVDMYGIQRGIRGDVSTGIVHRGDIEGRIYCQRVWLFPIQQEPYVTLDEQYYYVHKENIDLWNIK
jgi:hypothetical protein